MIRVLTVKQPWASLIIAGKKTIELRSWQPTELGRIAIHAGTSWDHRGDSATFLETSMVFVRGAIIGTVEIVDVWAAAPNDYIQACLDRKDYIAAQRDTKRTLYSWRLSRPVAIAPIPMLGQLGLWTYAGLE